MPTESLVGAGRGPPNRIGTQAKPWGAGECELISTWDADARKEETHIEQERPAYSTIQRGLQKWSPILVGNRCCNCTCFCAAAVACSLHDDVAIPPCFFLTSKTQTIYSPRHGHVGRQRLLPGMSYSIDSSLFSSGPSGSCELDLVAVKNEMDGCLVGHRVPAGSRNIRFFIRFISIHMCLSGLVWNLVEILFQSTPTHVDWCESDYIQTMPKCLEDGRLSVSGAFSNWARGEASFYTNAPSKI